MNSYIILGLFALYVGIMSLLLVLSGHEDALLERLRALWGRTFGHAAYFACRVAIPLLVCVLCLGWGVRLYDPAASAAAVLPRLHLNLDAYRTQERLAPKVIDADLYAVHIAA